MMEDRPGGLSSSARRFQQELGERGYAHAVIELPATTRTAQDAAAAIGCRVEQICKSLVFRTVQSRKPFLVVASGANRVDVGRVRQLLSEPIEMADADFVRQQTGYSIGGVPPTGHIQRLPTYLDEDLFQHPTVWAAAGHPHAVFELTPADLLGMTDGTVIRIK